MHTFFEQANGLTENIISAAIEVHRDKGPGILESIYEWCLMRERELRHLATVNQRAVVVEYKGFRKEEVLCFDLLVEKCVLVEVKAVQAILPIHQAQLLSYMKLLNIPIGLLVNFNVTKLTDGVSRLILAGADKP
jgi:GxxExxY protein